MTRVLTTTPAFPTDEYRNEERIGQTPGMTLRDYFAATALPIAATFFDTSNEVKDAAAEWAYKMADAMLKERLK